MKLSFVFLAAVVPLAAAVKSTLTSVDGGKFELSYQVDLLGLTLGNDVTNLYAAALDVSNNVTLSEEGPTTWSGTASTSMTHTFSVEPVKTILFGITEAVEGGGQGTDKDHIVLGASNSFVAGAQGKKWSQNFPGVSGAERMRHSGFVALLKDLSADPSNSTLQTTLTTFLQDELLPTAGFEPDVSFRLLRFSVASGVGKVFEDLNSNGMFDEGEGISNITVTIDALNCTSTFEDDGFTDADGSYTTSIVVNSDNCVVELTAEGLDEDCKLVDGFENPATRVIDQSSVVTVDFGFDCEPEPEDPCASRRFFLFRWLCRIRNRIFG